MSLSSDDDEFIPNLFTENKQGKDSPFKKTPQQIFVPINDALFLDIGSGDTINTKKKASININNEIIIEESHEDITNDENIISLIPDNEDSEIILTNRKPLSKNSKTIKKTKHVTLNKAVVDIDDSVENITNSSCTFEKKSLNQDT